MKWLKNTSCMGIRFILLVCVIGLLSSCSTLSPVTWEARIAKARKVTEPVLQYEEHGQGDVLLFLHGFGESRFTWRYLVDDLAKNHRLILLDLKGFGDSPKPHDGRYSIYDQAAAVKQFIEQHNLREVTLIGHSLGGGVALALALMAQQQPQAWRVKRLIVIDAAAYQQQLPTMLAELQRPLFGRLGVYLVSPLYQARQAYIYSFYNDKKIPAQGVQESAKNFARPGARYVYLQSARQLVPDDIEKVAAQYKRIRIPTLIIWGDHDRVIPGRFARRLHRDIKHSRLVWIKEAGHMPHEEQPQQVLQSIEQFL